MSLHAIKDSVFNIRLAAEQIDKIGWDNPTEALFEAERHLHWLASEKITASSFLDFLDKEYFNRVVQKLAQQRNSLSQCVGENTSQKIRLLVRLKSQQEALSKLIACQTARDMVPVGKFFMDWLSGLKHKIAACSLLGRLFLAWGVILTGAVIPMVPLFALKSLFKTIGMDDYFEMFGALVLLMEIVLLVVLVIGMVVQWKMTYPKIKEILATTNYPHYERDMPACLLNRVVDQAKEDLENRGGHPCRTLALSKAQMEMLVREIKGIESRIYGQPPEINVER
ncbi:MAG: hypothetical protein PHV34_19215 [Verrucomicrobiae bacterium]|nr:hypothetical protein [Verrucomicrobiae bacterium]